MKSEEVESKNPECFRIQDFWCGQQDSNLHAFAVEPKSTESTNSTMPAFIKLSVFRPVAVPGECPRRERLRPSPTAATRSGRCFRHRRRSRRSPPSLPIPPCPHTVIFYHEALQKSTNDMTKFAPARKKRLTLHNYT